MDDNAFGDLFLRVNELTRVLDLLIDETGPSTSRQFADWAYFRLASVNVLVKDSDFGGAVAATVARGLLEEAAYWDWAIAAEVGLRHIDHWTAVEISKLRKVAEKVGDNVWLDWLLPAGYAFRTEESSTGPKNVGEVVDRVGRGPDQPVLELLRFRGLYAAYQLLSVFSHGNLAAAMILGSGQNPELLRPLVAVITHVAAVGASVVVLEHCDANGVERENVLTAAKRVVEVASRIHQLPTEELKSDERPVRIRTVAPSEHTGLDIEYPGIPGSLLMAVKEYVVAAKNLNLAVGKSTPYHDAGAVLSLASFHFASTQISILSGVVEETLGASLLPFAARVLFEDGARWEWLGATLIEGSLAHPFSALEADSSNLIRNVVSLLEAEGVSIEVIQSLLGPSSIWAAGRSLPRILPSINELVSTAYPNPSGVDSAKPMYSVLSQFIHSTPISVLHLRTGQWTSLSAPVFAIAAEAACKGFTSIAKATLVMSLEESAEVRSRLRLLSEAAAVVSQYAAGIHFLG